MKARLLLLLLALALSGCLPLPQIGTSETPSDPVYLAPAATLQNAIGEIAQGLEPRPDFNPFAVTDRSAGFIRLTASSSRGDSTFIGFTLSGEGDRTTITPRGGGPGAREAIAEVLAELDRRFERAP